MTIAPVDDSDSLMLAARQGHVPRDRLGSDGAPRSARAW